MTVATGIPLVEPAPVELLHTAEAWLSGADVLVVDDVATNRLVLRGLLDESAASVRMAISASDAMVQFRERVPDIVIMDLMMPDMNGYDACRALRAMDHGGVLIIALSAHISDADLHRCLEAGIDGYLPKPLKMQDLLGELVRLGAGRRTGPRINVA
jgi:CheY-like chemotaxis protein